MKKAVAHDLCATAPFCMVNRKRYEVTCDSVSGRPQKQKAQIKALENLLKTERMIALFGCHYIPREYVMTPPSLI